MYRSFMGGIFGGFWEDMFRHMDARRKAEKKAQAGITGIGGLEGIERLGIPHKYHDILIAKDGYFSCHLDDTMTIYDKNGKLLFECHGAEYLEYGMFLVGLRPKKMPAGKSANDFGYALYNDDKKLTDPIFRTNGWNDGKFNKEGFCKLKLFDGYKEAAVDRSGKIIVQEESMSRYLTIKGVVCSVYKGYFNLLTGEMICEKKWGSSKELSTNDTLFVEVSNNCVYQINKSTGEFIIHGEPEKEKSEFEKATAVFDDNNKPSAKKEEPKKITAGRNDDCPLCLERGVKIKFKKCKEHYNRK